MHLHAVTDFLQQVNEHSAAVNLLDTFYKYAAILPQYAELAELYGKFHEYEKSLHLIDRCLQENLTWDQEAALRKNKASTCNKLNMPELALAAIQPVLERDPFNADARLEQSFSYYFLGDYAKSKEILEKLNNDPTLPDAVRAVVSYNLATHRLYEGNFKEGLRQLVTFGKELGIWPPLSKPYPRWNGEKTSATILVFAEAGIGDQFLHCRFMFDLKDQAIWVGGNSDVRSILARHGVKTVVNEQELDTLGDYIYTESSLLAVLLEKEQTELWQAPYLAPMEEYIRKWQDRLPARFITLRWSGNPHYEQDLHRSIPSNDLVSAVRAGSSLPIVSLQIDTNQWQGDGVITPSIDSWEDTLAIQSLASLNITSCTSTAHSAGAIGANTIVLPPIATYYPWIDLEHGRLSYWYNENLEVFPQIHWRDWSIPLQKVTDIVRQRYAK